MGVCVPSIPFKRYICIYTCMVHNYISTVDFKALGEKSAVSIDNERQSQ